MLDDLLENKTIDCVGSVFSRMSDYLKMYSTFCNNQKTSVETIKKLTEKNKEFVKFLEVCIFEFFQWFFFN